MLMPRNRFTYGQRMADGWSFLRQSDAPFNVFASLGYLLVNPNKAGKKLARDCRGTR